MIALFSHFERNKAAAMESSQISRGFLWVFTWAGGGGGGGWAQSKKMFQQAKIKAGKFEQLLAT